MRSGYFNVAVLAFSNALAFAVQPLMLLVGSLLGVKLAPSQDWATLPLALMVVGTAVGIVPATQAMQRLGRKHALWVFMGLGMFSCVLAGYSLQLTSFALFCSSAAMFGFTNAALQQIRFAAMECVDVSQSATAASAIMLTTVIAAVIGPELAVVGRYLTAVEYQGSFWLVAISILMAAILLHFYTPAKTVHSATAKPARPIAQLLKNPAFCLAIASAALGYLVMTFVMTGTPITMHNHHGHSLVDTKWVIQSHIAAMFLPSIISPFLFRLLGASGMMAVGLCCYGLTIYIGLLNTSVMGFWSQLVILGVGWNFMFVAGTALLPTTYLEGEQFKAQAFNDGTVFSIQALASLSAGWALSMSSWSIVLLICLVPMSLMVAILLWAVPKGNKISAD